MKMLVVITLGLLAGCAIASPYPDARGLQQSVMQYWTGQPLSAVEARYGSPNNCVSPSPLGNAHGCYWRESASRTYVHRTSTTVTGQIGDASQYPYNEPTQYTATIPGTRSEVERYECTLQIEVDGHGTIVAAGLAGKMGACAYFQP